ncbi:DUF7663 domain-containing protein [Sedimentisphaera salicampi]|uniref:DUF7663 domain-containing protein n=1 Tax=Sedimentisphaera salicampi TaxID=1941349 RepID=UPI000B9D14DD|nr:DUF6884 domain-containing protein [Sedimentisphaera salicampi]OXU14042.1 hypothetical protein SMSP1_02204 [Sedimentisphaera salicampi]
MSKKLLNDLNNDKQGKLKDWIDNFSGEPRIAWYPSAGVDFRDVLYFNEKFSMFQPPRKPEPPQPDIFIHTDYYPWTTSDFLDTTLIHRDEYTEITVAHLEYLSNLDIPLPAELVHFTENKPVTGIVIYMELNIRSDVLGEFQVPLIYAFVENAGFCSKKILKLNGQITHIYLKNWGCGLGGGHSGGRWVLNILEKVGCELLVTDFDLDSNKGCSEGLIADSHVYNIYPELSGNESVSNLEPIRVHGGFKGYTWSLVRERENMKKVILISCSNQKLSHKAPAKELYTSPLFKKSFNYAESLKPDKIFILSAKYGLLSPEQEINPYDKTLNNMDASKRRKWAGKVVSQLIKETDLQNDQFVLLCGNRYREYITGSLANKEIPLEGMRIGEQLRWLTENL